MAQSNSQSRLSSGRIRYLTELFRLHVQRLIVKPTFSDLLGEVELYVDLLAQHSHLSIDRARAMEIGVGQRPYRLAAIQSLGSDAWGVDLDRPVTSMSFGAFIENLRANGPLRAIKTAGRVLVFDGSDRAAFANAFAKRFHRQPALNADRILVGSAGDSGVWANAGGSFDLIWSEDVFEHIPPDDLGAVVQHMRGALTPNGIAVISPMVFTGICGGHSPEWYVSEIQRGTTKRTPPWGHLTEEAENPDTYLNRLSRQDYRSLFSRHFRILSETVVIPDLGRSFFTPEIKSKLQAYSEDELFSNKVRFVLAHKS